MIHTTLALAAVRYMASSPSGAFPSFRAAIASSTTVKTVPRRAASTTALVATFRDAIATISTSISKFCSLSIFSVANIQIPILFACILFSGSSWHM